jgi:HD-like signal output (HDOD) protein
VVGALVARVWRLAPEVTAAIRLHHELQVLAAEAAEAGVLTLLAVGLVADHLLRRQTALPPDDDWTANSAAALRWLQVGSADLAAWEEELSVVLADA